MGDKGFPASEVKLQRLRDEGVLPFTRDLHTFAVVLALLFSWLLFPWSALQSASGRWYSQRTDVPPPSVLREFIQIAGHCILTVTGVLAAVVLIVWLIQTRFYFRMRRQRREHGFLSFRLLGAAFGALLKVAVWATVIFFLFFSELKQLGGEERQKAEKELFQQAIAFADRCKQAPSACTAGSLVEPRIRPSLRIFLAVFGAALIMSFLIGILSRFMAGLAFHYEHRMSRQELDAEARENDSPQSLRRVLESERWPEITEN